MNEIFASARASPILPMLAFVAGIMLVQQLPALPSAWVMITIGTSALLLLFLRLRSLHVAAALLLGAAWAMFCGSARLDQTLPRELQRSDLTVDGTVAGIPQALEDGVRFDLQVKRLGEAGTGLRLVRLNWHRHAPSLKAGEHWRLRVRLKRPHGFFNPGGLDYEGWLLSHGIGATGYVLEDPANTRLGAASPWSMARWRQLLFDRVVERLAWSRFAGVVAALAMGDEGRITPDQWEVLRRTGTAHLVAISGSHIGLVAGFAFLPALRLCAALHLRRWPPPAVAAAAAAAAALCYSALADFAIPTQRALIMIAVVMGGIIWRRNLRPMHTLALALLAVTAYDPLAVLAPGLWLSFTAVALILWCVAGRLRKPGTWRELWRMNWATAFGLFPLLLLFFQQVSLLSPLANLVAVPTIGLIAIPWCLLASLAMLISAEAGGLLLDGVALFLAGIWQVLEWLSGLPWAQWRHAQPPFWSLCLALPGVALLLAPRGIPGRWLGLLLLAPAVATTNRVPDPGALRMTLLDVGQGLAAVLQTHRHTLVFDTGARFSPSFDMGSAVVEPFLLEQGKSHLDLLLVSHGDNDHMGGAQSLMNRFSIAGILTSVPERLAGSRLCRAGQAWNWDGVSFEILSPFGTAGNGNDNSCVLRVAAPGGCVLLTGDIEREAERRLAETYGERLRCDAIVAPHHGSRTSSTALLLALVKPRLALFSTGYLNPYGLPSREVLERYRAAGALVANTAEAGAITVEIDPLRGMGAASSYRAVRGRYWNAPPGSVTSGRPEP